MSAAPALTRDEFLAERRKGIGGSDVAAILGLDSRVTPYQLWREKVGMPDPDTGRPWARRRGNFLEAALLARYRDTVKPAEFSTQIPHRQDWRCGNQDARAVSGGIRRVVEAKTVHRRVFRSEWGAPWSDEVPDRALCQGLWYGNLDDASVVDFAVAVIPDDPDEVLGLTADEVMAASEFHIYQVSRSPEVEEMLVGMAGAFWHHHVIANVPPRCMTAEDIDLRFPRHIAGASKPAEPIVEILRRFEQVRAAGRENKKEAEDLRERILLYAEGSEYLTAPDGSPWLTLKTEDRAAHTVSASTSRTLRFSKWWTKANQTTPTSTEK